jgi:hypothetical protein
MCLILIKPGQLLKTINAAGVPLKGIIHAARVLDGALLTELNWKRLSLLTFLLLK